ncbi:thioredoxin family protein [Aequorivita sp. Q41]|uniref:thioredoxin family protein n=1 Tax=Aequorivita sp. Q41 TaxID=3153300 RepID=UPI00324300A4
MLKNYFVFHICLVVLVSPTFSQEKAVHWLSFEQLEDSLQKNPKKVFIHFYADWCTPCLKMQREVFTDDRIIEMLNNNYYALKMNVESKDTIYFGNEVFINKRARRRNPVHQIPLLMASQKGKPFTLPALIFLDEKFQAKARYFQYLNVAQLTKILN